MTNGTSVSSENLLFGILALQNDFVTRDQLVAATGVWIGDKSRSLESILIEQGALEDDERMLLGALVRKHLSKHNNDPDQSLRALSSLGSSVKNELTQFNDSMLTRSVAQVSLDRREEAGPDPYATQSIPVRDIGPSGVRFRVLRPHARGGLGKVSVALDGELNREVAFKELLDEYADNPGKRSRFLMEAEITGALEHPGIVPVYGLGSYADGRPFYAMRFIQGDSLKEAIEAFHHPRTAPADAGERTLQLRRLLARFIDVCEAIEYAHSRGVLHRDLKPGNIMLGKYGETLVVDWGLAKAVHGGPATPESDERPLQVTAKADTAATRMGTLVGTPGFMPPEQAVGKLDLLGPASDVYSLGATLYCLLTGRAPFTDGTLEETLAKVRRGDFAPPRELDRRVPRALESICLKAMALRPADRYASAQALADDVEHWLADEPAAAHRETALERAGRWMRRHRSWTLAGAATLLAVVIASLVAVMAINAARQREVNLRALAERTAAFDVRLLAEQQAPGVLSDATLRELNEQLRQIAAIPESDDAAPVRKQQLQAVYVADLLDSLRTSPFTDEHRDQFNARLQLFSEIFDDGRDPEFSALVSDLASRRDARLAEWDELFDLAAPLESAQLAAVFPQGVAVADDRDRLLRLATGDAAPWLPTSVPCPPGNISLAARFDPSWRNVPAVGLALNFSEQHRYDFLIAVPDFQPADMASGDWQRWPTLGERADRLDDRQIYLVIARDGEVLRRVGVAPPDGPLRLRVSREGNRLAMAVNNAAAVDVVDPFALPTNAPGRFAVFWPQAVRLEQLTAERQRAPREVTALERGDQLFAEDVYAALTAYRSAGNSPEAQYKAGLCLELAGNKEEYLQTMEAVADESPQDAVQWRLLANLRLMKTYADDENAALFRDRLRQLASQFDFTETARLLPASDRQLLFQDIRRIGQRSRIAISPGSDVADLQLATELDQVFNEDLQQRSDTLWRLADAYRVDAVYRNNPASYAEAERILRDLLGDDQNEYVAADRVRAALVSDLAWTLMEQEKYDEARQEVERWLMDERGQVRREYLPLLIDRARLAYLREDRDAALRDLDLFLQEVDEKKISHAEHAVACLLRGMIYEDRGDEKQAREEWLKALYRNWRTGPPAAAEFANAQGVEMIHLADSFNFQAIAAAWTGEITAEEANERLRMLGSGAGMGAVVVERVAQAAVTKDLIREVAIQIYLDPAGRQLARDTVLRKGTLRELHTRGAIQMLYTGMMLSAFRNDQPTPEENQFMRLQCQELFHAFEQPDMSTKDMVTFLEFWQARGSWRDWQKFSAKLPSQLAPSIGYFFGRMHLLHKKPDAARQFFDYVLEHPDAHSFAKDWARRDLETIKPPRTPSS